MHGIRPGAVADIPSVLHLTETWASEHLDTTGHPEHNSAEDVQSWVGPYFWVAEHDQQVVGFVVGFVDDDSNTGEHDQLLEDGESHLSLDQLYVHPAYRNRGIGSRLVRQLLAAADEQGVPQVLVHSDNTDWVRTATFYQRNGFTMWFIKLYRCAQSRRDEKAVATR